jgi:methylglutaconyl-CoA hydratase
MADPRTDYQRRGGAAWITLNSPENRNALSDDLVESLRGHVEKALADAAVRCIVLTGAGSAFCAGADLKAARLVRPAPPGPSPFVQLLLSLCQSPKPVIAAVNGAAFAGGLGLVAAADIAIASDTVKFSFSEVRIGVIPAIISVVCVPRLGASNSGRLFMTGETFDAQDAVRYGLIHLAVPSQALEATVTEQVEMITRNGPIAVAEAKQLVRQISGEPLDAAFAWTQAKSAAMFASAEAQEGMAAFREKRSPAWVAATAETPPRSG